MPTRERALVTTRPPSGAAARRRERSASHPSEQEGRDALRSVHVGVVPPPGPGAESVELDLDTGGEPVAGRLAVGRACSAR
ncbi:hypothetical protein HFP72_06635 [Nocardiopsis sp. ARC36]